MDGILIAFDGIDGAGKTTQVDMIRDALVAAGERVTASKEPTNGPWGKRLRESATTGRMSLAEELEAFVEDRRQHVAEVIRPALDRGEIVLLDRYYYSTIAYQGSRGANVEVIQAENERIAPHPDVSFILDVDPRISLLRISEGRGEIPNHFEREDSLAVVRGIFDSLAKNDDSVRMIDASRSIGEVYGTIARVLVEGVLRDKRLPKAYDCDVFYRSMREAGQGRWAYLYTHLIETRPNGTLPALLK